MASPVWGLSAPAPAAAMAMAILLVLLVLAAFAPCLQNDFVSWDDEENFQKNPDYHGLGWSQIRWAWTSFHMGVFQPLAWILLEIQYVLWGLQPWGYHLTSLVLYALDTVVLFVLTVDLLQRCRPGTGREESGALWLGAGLAVALFAVHPLRTEVVAWVSCQPYLPCAWFAMLTVLAYLRAFPEGSAPRRGWLVGAFGLFVAALLSKAVAVSLPLVLLILDVYPLRRLGGSTGRWFGPAVRRVWWEKVPFLALSLIFMGLAVIGRVKVRHLVPVQDWSSSQRIAQACYGIWFYALKTVWPWNIAAYYPVPERVVWFEFPFGAGILGTLGVSAGLFLLRRRWPGLLAVWLSYLVILAPNLGLIRIGNQIAADRYSYIAMMGGVVLVAAGFGPLWHVARRAWPAAAGLTVASLGVLLGLILLSREQCRIWHTSESLWAHAVSHGAGGSFLAHNNLGVALLELGRTGEAGEEFEEALRLDSGYARAHFNLGVLLGRQGRVEEAKAHYARALQLIPDYADPHYNLGVILLQQGQFEQAWTEFSEALRINPVHAEALSNRGVILLNQGRFEEARADFSEAVRFKPDYFDAHYNLGLVLKVQGRFADALAQYAEAARLNPDSAAVHNDCALVWAAAPEAACRDGRRAVAAATRACELTGWNNAGTLATLAAAWAEAGDMAAAVRWQSRAIEILKDEPRSNEFRSRLGLYMAGQPYREAGTATRSQNLTR